MSDVIQLENVVFVVLAVPRREASIADFIGKSFDDSVSFNN